MFIFLQFLSCQMSDLTLEKTHNSNKASAALGMGLEWTIPKVLGLGLGSENLGHEGGRGGKEAVGKSGPEGVLLRHLSNFRLSSVEISLLTDWDVAQPNN